MQFRIVLIFLKWDSYKTFEEQYAVVESDRIEETIRKFADNYRKISAPESKGVLVDMKAIPVEIPGLKEIWNKQGRGHAPYPHYQKE